MQGTDDHEPRTATGEHSAPPAPFARGSVSIRLYPHSELAAEAIVGELVTQAALALDGGFDGVMTSEHHGGFAGYLPNPQQIANFVLDVRPSGWAAASPLLLPLRPTALVAEEAAWLRARHPGRVGLGVAPGSLPSDFDAYGVPFEGSAAVFANELPRLVRMLRGEDLGPLSGDPALRACADAPVPVLGTAVSAVAAVRAARCGAGILMEGMSAADRLARLTAAYTDAGGGGPKVLIRRVWLGELPRALVRRQREVYERYAVRAAGFGDDQTVATRDAGTMTERLTAIVRTSGADALNLRVHLPGMAAGAVRDQIDRLADEVVAPLRAGLALPGRPGPSPPAERRPAPA